MEHNDRLNRGQLELVLLLIDLANASTDQEAREALVVLAERGPNEVEGLKKWVIDEQATRLT